MENWQFQVSEGTREGRKKERRKSFQLLMAIWGHIFPKPTNGLIPIFTHLILMKQCSCLFLSPF